MEFNFRVVNMKEDGILVDHHNSQVLYNHYVIIVSHFLGISQASVDSFSSLYPDDSTIIYHNITHFFYELEIPMDILMGISIFSPGDITIFPVFCRKKSRTEAIEECACRFAFERYSAIAGLRSVVTLVRNQRETEHLRRIFRDLAGF